MKKLDNIAVLLTSFNRILLTLKCIEKLSLSKIKLDIFLVDDGSTDNTSESIARLYPHVHIIKGSGKLFWNRGMHLAWQTASSIKDYDFYLWLNDDVLLYENCFEELFDCSYQCKHKAIISGIIESENKNEILYGGTDKYKKLLKPNGGMQAITHMNGNIVLVPKYVFRILGNLDPIFHHDLGDVDYGLRANKNNIGVYCTRISIGSGIKNPISRLRQNNSNLIKRFKTLYSPLGNPPGINFYFRKNHKGLLNAMTYWLFLHFLNIIPDTINRFLFNKKYS